MLFGAQMNVCMHNTSIGSKMCMCTSYGSCTNIFCRDMQLQMSPAENYPPSIHARTHLVDKSSILYETDRTSKVAIAPVEYTVAPSVSRCHRGASMCSIGSHLGRHSQREYISTHL